MDLSKLDTKTASNKGRKMEVLDGDGVVAMQDNKTPVTITLLGADSDYCASRIFNVTDARNQRFMRTKSLTTEAAAYQDKTRLFAGCTVAWEGIERDGKPVECTNENAFALYTEFPLLRRQVEDFINDSRNFTTASQTT